MPRWLKCAACAALVCAVLVCSPVESFPPETTPDEGVGGTIRLMDSHLSQHGPDETIYLAVDCFLNRRPQAAVELETTPMTGRTNIFLTAMAAGDGPDIICMGDIGDYVRFRDGGHLRNLNEFYEHGGGQEFIDSFLPAAMEQLYTDGAYWGMPHWAGVYLYLYNQELYREAGIEALPRSWEEFAQVASALTDGETYGFTMQGIDEPTARFFHAYVWMNGGEVTNRDFTQVRVNSSRCVEALEYLNHLVNDLQVVPPGNAQADGNISFAAFVEERAATIYDGNWAIRNILRDNPALLDRVGTYYPPTSQMRTTIGMFTPKGITSQCRNVPLAEEFLLFLAEPDTQLLFLEQAGFLPVRLEVIEDQLDHPVYGSFIGALRSSRMRVAYPNATAVNDAIIGAIQEVYLGISDAQTALDKAQATIENALNLPS